MAFNKNPLNATEPRELIEYSQDLENRVENEFESVDEDIKNRILVQRGLTDTVGGGGALTFNSNIEIYNIMLTDITGSDVEMLYVAWKIHFQANRDRYVVYFYDRRNGNNIESGAEVTYTRIFNYR